MMVVPFSANTRFNLLRQRLRGECLVFGFPLEKGRLSNGVHSCPDFFKGCGEGGEGPSSVFFVRNEARMALGIQKRSVMRIPRTIDPKIV
jgi:hypothetical protein